MKAILKTLGIYFILVALPRVAVYANRFTLDAPTGAAWNPYNLLGIFFALGLGLGVYACSYFASDKVEEEDDTPLEQLTPAQRAARKRRERDNQRRQVASQRARTASYVFAGIDGLFNLSEASAVAVSHGLIANISTPLNGDWLAVISVWLFGLVPTLASFLAGWVVAAVDKVPDQHYTSGQNALAQLWALFIARLTPRTTPTPLEPAALPLNRSYGDGYDAYKNLIQSGDAKNMLRDQIARTLGVSLRTVDRYRQAYKEEVNSGTSTGPVQG